MLKNILEKVAILPYVIQNDKIEEDRICVRVNDESVTDEMYENGAYYTKEFVKKMTKDVKDIVNINGGALADFLKVQVNHQDKDWFEIKVMLK
ncbi:MAG: hypothetical protein J6J36_06765 [Clostridia bacterium]|nr:hypothetical protein [Clostridia bacterium]